MINKYKKLSVVAKASIWALIANIIQRGMSVLVVPIFTRILTVEEFSQYTLYQSWHDLFIIFSSLNVFSYAIYSGLKEFDDDKDRFISSAQIFVTGLSVICLFIYYIINIFIKDITGFPMSIMILMFLDILFFSAFNIWAGRERYEFRYKLMTILSILMGILSQLLGIVAVYISTNRGYGRIYASAFVNIIIGLAIYIYCLKKANFKFSKKYIKFFLTYCIPLIPHFLSFQVLSKFDRIMIGKMCSEAEAGVYSLAYNLSYFTQIVNDSIIKVLTPWTYKIIKQRENLKKLKKNTNFLILLVALVNIVLILFAPELMRIFAPAEYSKAIYIVPAVSASVYFMFLFNIFANIEYYYNETKYVGVASVAAAVCNIVLNAIFIKKYGFIAAGYTTLVSYILYAIGHFIFMRKVCKKNANGIDYYDNKFIFITSLIFTILAILIIPFYKSIVIRYILILIIFVVLASNYKKVIKVLKLK